jgi:hypothetical protein
MVLGFKKEQLYPDYLTVLLKKIRVYKDKNFECVFHRPFTTAYLVSRAHSLIAHVIF